MNNLLGKLIRNFGDVTDNGLYRVIELKRINGVWSYVAISASDWCKSQTIGGTL